MKLTAILVLLLATLELANATGYYRVCYYTNWSQYRKGDGNYDLSKHYEKGLCTHIIYAFAKVVNEGNGEFPIIPYEENDQSDGYPKVSVEKLYSLSYIVLWWIHSSIFLIAFFTRGEKIAGDGTG